MQTPAPLYQYIPLISDGSTFRVVSISPGIDEDRIECNFLEIPTSAKPQYSALSYAWGNPDIIAFVWHHGRVIGIADNLNHALRRLRDPVQVRHFWIDALCINQHDEAGEKTTQIPLMRRIYQYSATGIIYLGRSHHGSDAVPNLCDRITRAYDQSQMSVQEAPYSQPTINSDSYQEFDLPDVRSGLWKIVRRFLCRPWFTRVWVIQEAALLTSAEVICGTWSMDWKYLLRALVSAAMLGLPVISGQAGAGPFPGSLTGPKMSATQLIFMLALGAGESEYRPWKLIDLLHRGRISTASRPHDYCYGLLGLSKEFDDPDLKVDYELSVETVYCQFARYLVGQGDGVGVLYNACGHDLDLPSWVPDWSYRCIPEAQIAPQPRATIVTDPFCAAATSFSSLIRPHSSAPDLLIVRGLIFDYVEELGVCHSSFDATDHDRDHSARPRRRQSSNVSFNIAGEASSTGDECIGLRSSILLIADCITELCQLLYRGQREAYPTGEADETVIWKTLICSRAKGCQSKAPPTYAEFFRNFLALVISHDPSWQPPHGFHANPIDVAELIRYGISSVVNKGNVIIGGAIPLCYTKRRGRTECGYVGQFPLDARVGDLIFIPLGSAIPFLIRSGPKEIYKLIGDCYVHGIMEGEAFSLPRARVDDVYVA